MFPEYLLKAGEKLLPHLVRCVRVRKTITRKELGDLVGIGPDLQLPRALDAVHQAICNVHGLPDLTCIVVDGPGEMPSSAALFDQVYVCPDWDRLLGELGLDLPETQPKELEAEGYAYTNFLTSHLAAEKESKPLIDYVAEHPQRLGLRTWRAGVIDHRFISGDDCDVLFDRDGLPVIAAIATRHRGSLIRGIFRLIKQRALLEAEKGRGEPLTVQCFLVAQIIPLDIQDYAARFQINCLEIDNR
jgi:hypothetical protein